MYLATAGPLNFVIDKYFPERSRDKYVTRWVSNKELKEIEEILRMNPVAFLVLLKFKVRPSYSFSYPKRRSFRKESYHWMTNDEWANESKKDWEGIKELKYR